MCGFIAQLIEHRTGIAEVTGSNPVEALIFFGLLLSYCLSWKVYCDDHSSLSWYKIVTQRSLVVYLTIILRNRAEYRLLFFQQIVTLSKYGHDALYI